MKFIVAVLALSLSFMVGCQCTEEISPVPAQEEMPTEAVPSEEEIPVEEQKEFETLDESLPIDEVPTEEDLPEQAL